MIRRRGTKRRRKLFDFVKISIMFAIERNCSDYKCWWHLSTLLYQSLGSKVSTYQNALLRLLLWKISKSEFVSEFMNQNTNQFGNNTIIFGWNFAYFNAKLIGQKVNRLFFFISESDSKIFFWQMYQVLGRY